MIPLFIVFSFILISVESYKLMTLKIDIFFYTNFHFISQIGEGPIRNDLIEKMNKKVNLFRHSNDIIIPIWIILGVLIPIMCPFAIISGTTYLIFLGFRSKIFSEPILELKTYNILLSGLVKILLPIIALIIL